jgi:hypothetical protein
MIAAELGMDKENCLSNFNHQHWNENGLCYDGTKNLTDDQWLRAEQVCNNLSDKTEAEQNFFDKDTYFLTNKKLSAQNLFPRTKCQLHSKVLQHGGKRWKRWKRWLAVRQVHHLTLQYLWGNFCCNIIPVLPIWLHVTCVSSYRNKHILSHWRRFSSIQHTHTHTKSDIRTCTPEMIPNMVGNSFVYSCKREADNSN